MTRIFLGPKVLSSLALCILLAGCTGTATTPDPSKTNCGINVQHPHESTGSPGKMDGKATVTCDGAVSSLDIKLYGQLVQSGGFVTKASSITTAKNVSPTKKVVRQWNLSTCISGTWRTKAILTMYVKTKKGGYSSDTATVYGGEAVVRCR